MLWPERENPNTRHPTKDILQHVGEELADLRLEFRSSGPPTHAPEAVLCKYYGQHIATIINRPFEVIAELMLACLDCEVTER
eukprot:5592207-Amphidinium_carterae.1